MFKLLKSHYLNFLAKRVDVNFRPNYINTNPHLMKLLVKSDPSFLLYTNKKAIDKEIIYLALRSGISSDDLINFVTFNHNSKVFNDKDLVKEMCKVNGRVLNYVDNENITLDSFLIAISHKDRRIKYEPLVSSLKNVDYEEMRKIIEYDGSFIKCFYHSKITPELLELAFNNPKKKASIDGLPFSFYSSEEIMKSLCKINGKYFLEAQDAAITYDLIEIATNNEDPNKRLTIDDLEENYSSKKKFPYGAIKKLIDEDKRWLRFVDEDDVPKDKLKDFLNSGYLKLDNKLINKYMNDEEMLDYFIEVIENNSYGNDELMELLRVKKPNLKFLESNFFMVISKRICKDRHIDYEWFTYNLIRNIVINSYVLEDVQFPIFDERFNCLFSGNKAYRLNDILVFYDIQKSLIDIGYDELDDKFGKNAIKLLARMLDSLEIDNSDKETTEWIPYFAYLVDNIKEHRKLYRDFIERVDEMDDELIKRLTFYILGQHSYSITTVEDLKNYDKVRNRWIKTMISTPFSGLDNLWIDAHLEKIFGISYRFAEVLDKVYGDAVIENPEMFSKDIVDIFKALRIIRKEESEEHLEEIFKATDNYSIPNEEMFIKIKSLIRKKVTKAYRDSVYDVKKEKAYDSLEDVDLYLAAGSKGDKDFRLLLHVLGAYNNFVNLDDISGLEDFNYHDIWNQPDTRNHGICCSYIGNFLLTTTMIDNAVIGFSNFEDDSFLLCGTDDIYSANDSFNIIGNEEEKANWLFPDKQLDCTRGSDYNEVVLERKVGSKKRQPQYVVFICDDLEEAKKEYLELGKRISLRSDAMDRSSGELLGLSIKAAKEFNIPIVVVEKRKILESNKNRIKKSLDDFINDDNLDECKIKKYFHDTIINLEICGSNGGYFNDVTASNMLKDIKKKVVKTLEKDYDLGMIMVKELEHINELNTKAVGYNELFDYEDISNFCINMHKKYGTGEKNGSGKGNVYVKRREG